MSILMQFHFIYSTNSIQFINVTIFTKLLDINLLSETLAQTFIRCPLIKVIMVDLNIENSRPYYIVMNLLA